MSVVQNQMTCILAWCARLTLVFAIGIAGIVTSGQDEKTALPSLISGAIPLYPPLARTAHVQGIVRLHISTDGKRVSAVVSSGPPMLIKAAEANVRTWEFKVHNPTTFDATFRYTVLPESACELDNGTVVLHLPTEAEITVKGVQTCDPTSN
jgi:hypothetical protein